MTQHLLGKQTNLLVALRCLLNLSCRSPGKCPVYASNSGWGCSAAASYKGSSYLTPFVYIRDKIFI
ncbi:Selenocysteine methyltransferase [Senna tora]|uniref:Selenocysteine methyltransferase n=1 Tax=Senna tora TaxID=362788 RepID=A0A834WDA0_9FABA|nr:Selenocysteine methyltransferase [Senna tora]